MRTLPAADGLSTATASPLLKAGLPGSGLGPTTRCHAWDRGAPTARISVVGMAGERFSVEVTG